MPIESLTHAWRTRRLFGLSPRTRRLVLLLVCGACYLFGVGYHLTVWSAGRAAPMATVLLYQLAILLGYVSLWRLLSYLFRQRPSNPARILWTLLLAGLLFVGSAALVARIGRLPTAGPETVVPGFDLSGVPLTLATVFKMNVLSLLEASFAFLLLLRLRDFVLFKRSKASLRNWYVMIGFMALAACATFMKPPEAPLGDPVLGVAMVPAVVFMVINSFRLSWIVYLPFRQKMISAGLILLLLGLLVGGLGYSGQGLLPGAAAYMRYYSYPLFVFALLSTLFGILYCVTALLSLLFHLPTTGEIQRRADEMAALHALTLLVGQVFDFDRLVATIATSPVEAGSGDAAWLALADPQSGSLRPRLVAAHAFPLDRIPRLVDVPALHEEVEATGEPLLLNQALVDHRVHALPSDSLCSLLVLPLVARNGVLGALFVSKEVTHGFERDDVEALRVFAAQAALALDNARLFEEQLEKERMARELSIAREVQHRLLPQHVPALHGVTLAASSVSAQEVGGDYYDFVQLDEDRLAVIVADVSGKGTSAAFYMAELQGIFRAVSRLAPAPQDFLCHANEALFGALERNTFISVIYGVLDLREETFVLARAGHSPAATIRLDGTARFLRTRGLGLGLDRGPLFRQSLAVEAIRLEPGDVFAFYTDGVVESRGPGDEEYGYDRLLAALRAHRHEDAPELHAALLRNLNDFIGHDHYDDDLTLVVLKWHGVDVARAATPGAARAAPRAAPKTPARTSLLK